MAGVVLLSFLAALGVVLLIVCVCGWLWLPCDCAGYSVICVVSERDLRSVRAYLFLLRCGIIRLPLMLVDCSSEPAVHDGLILLHGCSGEVRYFTPEKWQEYIETERSTGVLGT